MVNKNDSGIISGVSYEIYYSFEGYAYKNKNIADTFKIFILS